ncbi:rod shape-determining protein [Fructobacillus ficulneus]|uniref:Cell shape-determining protein MreB n=1 Tax=Fructobacillus ficulneus TaxID=157463 RepID=A0A0K8MHU5_9LACO|nr:rod shape-determining protein [Fructobacillus ficulneus]GAP00003.1 rod shape-determining protein MreB [Fructobacillus ficulneus]
MALSFGQHNVGIDLGTTNTYVYVEGKGIVLREPSVVARNTETQEVIAVGEEARAMLGRTPASIAAIRPMRDGVIADYDTTVAMISYYLNKALGGRVGKPYVTLGVPARITAVERRAVIDAARVAGAKDAYVIEEPFAAAIGAGLPVMEPTGSMVVDLGGGTTDVATISLGGIVAARSTRFAGDKLNDSITSYIRNNYNLAIGESTAERLKIEVGTVSLEDAMTMEPTTARGRDLLTGLPKTIEVQAIDVAKSIQDPINAIVNSIRETLESTQPEISADVIDHGMVLTGGGAQLRGLTTLIEGVTKVPVIVAEDPLDAVVKGVGESLKSLEVFQRS